MPNRADALLARAADCGDKLAIRFEGVELTFAELAEQALQMAGALAKLGIERGSHVGILLPASPDFIVVQQALFLLGAPVTPINVMYRAAEITQAIGCCDLEFLVTTRGCAAEPLPPGCRVLLIDSNEDNSAGASIPQVLQSSDRLRQPAQLRPSDIVFHLMTSATTGKAKGVALTLANLAANYDRTPDWLGLGRKDIILCALPLYNTFGLNQCINAMLVTRAPMTLLPRFNASQCIASISENGCTFLPAVPTMLQKIFDQPEATSQRLASIRLIMTGGAPVPSSLLRRIKAKLPDVEVLTGYGLTEATALVTLASVRLGPDGELERGRTIGKVLDGMKLAICSEDGTILAPGQTGEIIVSGPNLMYQYHGAPSDTHAALRNGWLHTGDIGYIDEEGYAFIVDRKKDIIIRGGQNIYPVEIEEALYQAEGIAEVAVVGRDDDLFGEVPVAYVAFAGEQNLNAAELLEHCRERLAKYKLPAAIEILPELPKGPTGKILRRQLRTPSEETA